MESAGFFRNIELCTVMIALAKVTTEDRSFVTKKGEIAETCKL